MRKIPEDFKEIWAKYRGDKSAISKHYGWTSAQNLPYSRKVSYYESALGLLLSHPPTRTAEGTRGPARKDYRGAVQNGWVCVISHAQGKKHLWRCKNMNCKKTKLGTNSQLNNTKECGCNRGGGKPVELIAVASDELNKEVEAELQVADPEEDNNE